MGTPTARIGSVSPALGMIPSFLRGKVVQDKKPPEEKVPNGSGKSQEGGCREQSKNRSSTKERCWRQGENVEEMSNGKSCKSSNQLFKL